MHDSGNGWVRNTRVLNAPYFTFPDLHSPPIHKSRQTSAGCVVRKAAEDRASKWQGQHECASGFMKRKGRIKGERESGGQMHWSFFSAVAPSYVLSPHGWCGLVLGSSGDGGRWRGAEGGKGRGRADVRGGGWKFATTLHLPQSPTSRENKTKNKQTKTTATKTSWFLRVVLSIVRLWSNTPMTFLSLHSLIVLTEASNRSNTRSKVY